MLTDEEIKGIKKRSAALLAEAGIDQKMWCKMTGLSRGQYYRYHSQKEAGGATVVDMVHCCKVFDWSPNYVLFGIGKTKLSEAMREPASVDAIRKIATDIATEHEAFFKRVVTETASLSRENQALLREIHCGLRIPKSVPKTQDKIVFK